MDKATPTPASVDSVMALFVTAANARASWMETGFNRADAEQAEASLRAEVERLAAQAAPTEAPQEFESAQGRALASAWAEGWTQCRDAEYVGEEAQSEAFNQSYTLAQCLHADQTRLQGGLSNDQLRRAWGAKLPRVIPTDEQLTAFALGIEIAAQPSQAPVVQASTDANHVSISNAFNTGGGTLMGAAGLDADNVSAAPVQTVQATPKLLEDLKLWAEQNQGAYLIPDWDGNRVLRHLNAATTAQAVRMLTEDELHMAWVSAGQSHTPARIADAVQREFCAVNAGKRIPASGEIGKQS